jgi:hypothetical protein
MPQQLTRVRCYYPQSHPHLIKTPVLSPGKHVCVQGVIVGMENDHCVIIVRDIIFGPSDNVTAGPSTDSSPPGTLKRFDWRRKDKGKEPAKRTRRDTSMLFTIDILSSKCNQIGYTNGRQPTRQLVPPTTPKAPCQAEGPGCRLVVFQSVPMGSSTGASHQYSVASNKERRLTHLSAKLGGLWRGACIELSKRAIGDIPR